MENKIRLNPDESKSFSKQLLRESRWKLSLSSFPTLIGLSIFSLTMAVSLYISVLCLKVYKTSFTPNELKEQIETVGKVFGFSHLSKVVEAAFCSEGS
ncbi:MAG: hypothetical protein HRU09_09660 [Oligoflexales bacterium]|nr:hypothetical protein [Oligoflexales bacterium]